MRGVCEGQVDMWKGRQHAQAEKAPSSHSQTWFMFFCEPCSNHPPLEPPSSCPCPRATTSPANQKQEEEEGVKKENSAKTKTLTKVSYHLPIAYQLRFFIDEGIHNIVLSH